MKTCVVGLLFPVAALSLTACGSIEYGETARQPLVGIAGPRTEVSISVEIFYQELAPYGQWIDAPQVGRAFVPHDPAYRPYRNGHWSQSRAGFVWVSYDAIGWAVCHYGSWAVLDDGRWAWVPDTEWGPAWVEWRESEDYVGWSPRMAYVAPSVAADATWVFIETGYLLADYVSQYFVESAHTSSVYASSPPMAHHPDRAWLDDHRVGRAYAGGVGAVASRGVRGSHRSAAARGVTVRGAGRAGAPDATARSVTVRGPAGARPGLTERPLPPARPRETVVLGAGRARRTSPTASVVVAPPPARSGPPLVLRSPTPRVQVNPAARAPRIVRPMPSAPPPRVVRAPRATHQTARPAPRPMIVQRRPVRSAPAPRVYRSQPTVRTSRPIRIQRAAPASRVVQHRSQPQRHQARATSRPATRSRPTIQSRPTTRSRPTTTRRVAPSRSFGGARTMRVRPR